VAKYEVTLDDGHAFNVAVRQPGNVRAEVHGMLEHGVQEEQDDGWVFYPGHRVASIRYKQED
jgi:hypothetical protein